jgi:hypothetical protein
MQALRPWLSHNCLRQAFRAFDMDNPDDMPQRPILQITKLGSATVIMDGKRMTTLKSLNRPSKRADVDFNVPMAEWDRIPVLPIVKGPRVDDRNGIYST